MAHGGPSDEAAARAAAVVYEHLDWEVLAEVYCDHGGAEFWQRHRAPALRLGLVWAEALRSRLAATGDSLYVGAGVADLPALIGEVVAQQRRCVAVSRRADECRVLNAALAVAGLADRLRVEVGEAHEAVAAGPFDHLSMVSVLDDPEEYPNVSGVTYGRLPPVDLDVPAFLREREELCALVDALLGALRCPAVITTTVEEVPWVMARRGRRVVVADDVMIDTAVVGDPIGFLRIEERGADGA